MDTDIDVTAQSKRSTNVQKRDTSSQLINRAPRNVDDEVNEEEDVNDEDIEDETKRDASADDYNVIDFQDDKNNNIEIRNADSDDDEISSREAEADDSEVSNKEEDVSEESDDKTSRSASKAEGHNAGNLNKLIDELQDLTPKEDGLNKREDTASKDGEAEKRDSKAKNGDPNSTLTAEQIQQEIEKLLQQ